MWLGAWTVLSSDYYVPRTPINTFMNLYEEKSEKETSSQSALARETQILGRIFESMFEFRYSFAEQN